MTRSTVAASARFRQRKLSTRIALQILREDQVQPDAESHQNVTKLETGVEKGEEGEHHLQAVLFASQASALGGKVDAKYIPTPETVKSTVEYEHLYHLRFSQPATYIRFSSTVEDCCACPYNLTDEDDAKRAAVNQRRPAATQCSEDQFEELMHAFEETAQARQPFASVDNPPVVTWPEMDAAVDENLADELRPLAREVYEHWRARRLANGNTALQPGLKLKVLETASDADDNDPYVCFRRREVRQVRKTRGRDAQSAEKLKKLRKELEEARGMIALVLQREHLKRDSLLADGQLFEQRTSLRQLKRTLPDQFKEGDEDLLIHQKPQKKKPSETGLAQRPQAPPLRIPSRSDGLFLESDLRLLDDLQAQKEHAMRQEIALKIAQHEKWNQGFIDMTQAPLTPPLEHVSGSSYRTACAEYLPTPPASIASDHASDALPSPDKDKNTDTIVTRYTSPTYDGPPSSQPAYRRRIGRGGRLMIDRRAPTHHAFSSHMAHLDENRALASTPSHERSARIAGRFKYDRDDDDDDQAPTYTLDPYDLSPMRYRAAISMQLSSQNQAARRPQIEAAPAGMPIAATATTAMAMASIPRAGGASTPL